MDSLQHKSDFEIVYDKYADMLYRLALVNVQHPSDAEDVVHDVFIKFFQHQFEFTDEKHREAWLVKVTVNACRDHNRKKSYRTYTPLEEIHHEQSEETQESNIMFHLSQLPERYRSVITLHYLEGFSVEEIASILRIGVSAVKMRLSRGRQMLKNLLEKEV
jgi:RNA polymerase sigma-70 factor (ECF subfamily)